MVDSIDRMGLLISIRMYCTVHCALGHRPSIHRRSFPQVSRSHDVIAASISGLGQHGRVMMLVLPVVLLTVLLEAS